MKHDQQPPSRCLHPACSAPRVLRLTLKKRWFDMIVSGVKKEEYREIKDWIISRLHGKSYEAVEFSNGYGAHVPKVTVEFLGWHRGPGLPEWGATPMETTIIIRLGRILSRQNYDDQFNQTVKGATEILPDLTQIQDLAAKTALTAMLQGEHFSICKVREVAAMFRVTINTPGCQQPRVRLRWARGYVSISVLQLAFLAELRSGPSEWYYTHAEARDLTRRGLARYRGHFVITEKGRDVLRSASRDELQDASRAADRYDAEVNKPNTP